MPGPGVYDAEAAAGAGAGGDAGGGVCGGALAGAGTCGTLGGAGGLMFVPCVDPRGVCDAGGCDGGAGGEMPAGPEILLPPAGWPAGAPFESASAAE